MAKTPRTRGEGPRSSEVLMKKPSRTRANAKSADLAQFVEDGTGEILTTNQGAASPTTRTRSRPACAARRCSRTSTSARRSPTSTTSASPSASCTRAARPRTATSRSTSPWASTRRPAFLQDPAKQHAGVRALLDRARARAARPTPRATCAASPTKFYTDEGNCDLVGNNIPVFFIQDAIKFPDLVHAVKPEPHNEMPQAAIGARHVLGLRLADAREPRTC